MGLESQQMDTFFVFVADSLLLTFIERGECPDVPVGKKRGGVDSCPEVDGFKRKHARTQPSQTENKNKGYDLPVFHPPYHLSHS